MSDRELLEYISDRLNTIEKKIDDLRTDVTELMVGYAVNKTKLAFIVTGFSTGVAFVINKLMN